MGAIGVVTEAAIAEGEVINHTVLGEGGFCLNYATQFVGLIVYITGGAVVDSELQPTKVLPICERKRFRPVSMPYHVPATPCGHTLLND